MYTNDGERGRGRDLPIGYLLGGLISMGMNTKRLFDSNGREYSLITCRSDKENTPSWCIFSESLYSGKQCRC